MDKLMASVDEAATALDVSRSTIWNLIKDGEIQTVKIRGRRLVPLTELRRLAGVGQGAA